MATLSCSKISLEVNASGVTLKLSSGSVVQKDIRMMSVSLWMRWTSQISLKHPRILPQVFLPLGYRPVFPHLGSQQTIFRILFSLLQAVCMFMCVFVISSQAKSSQPKVGEDLSCWLRLWSERIPNDFKHWCPLLFGEEREWKSCCLGSCGWWLSFEIERVVFIVSAVVMVAGTTISHFVLEGQYQCFLQVLVNLLQIMYILTWIYISSNPGSCWFFFFSYMLKIYNSFFMHLPWYTCHIFRCKK